MTSPSNPFVITKEEDAYLKIGFIGAGGTGKTSVAKLLESQLSEPFRPSIVRATMEGLGINHESDQNHLTEEQRYRIQLAIFEAKLKQDKEHQYGLFDRTPIDHLAYCMHRCANVIPDDDWCLMLTQAQDAIRRYDLIFFFPYYHWGVPTDGFRQEGLAYKTKIELLQRALLNDLGIDFIELTNVAPEDRAIYVHNCVIYQRNVVLSRGTARWYQD